jgi:hypothetical protein
MLAYVKMRAVMAPGRLHTILLLSGLLARQLAVALAMPADTHDGSGTMTEKPVLTPGGLRPESEVHKIAPGHVLDASGGRLRELDADGNIIADYGPMTPEKAKGLTQPGSAPTTEPEESR